MTSLAVNACGFDDNTSLIEGAIAFGPVNPGRFLTVRESSFESNQAEDDGDAIFAEGDSVTVEDNTFLRNRAGGNGGAVQLDDNDEYTFRRVIFGNTADLSGRGGALYDNVRLAQASWRTASSPRTRRAMVAESTFGMRRSRPAC